MSSVFETRGRTRRALRFMTIAAVSAVVAACSSSANRFGPYDESNWASANPGGSAYPSAPASRTASARQYPNQDAPSYTAAIDSNGSGDSITRRPLDEVRPSYQPSYQSQSVPAPARQQAQAGGVVVVRPGDTAFSISRQYGVTVGELAQANRIPPPYTIKVGQRLSVPNGAGAAQPRYAAAQPAQVSKPAAPAAPRQVAQAPAAKAGVHQVRPGETIYALSRQYNVKPMKIAAYNNISAPYSIQVGEKVRIPGTDLQVASAAASARETAQPVKASASPVVDSAAKSAPATQERKVAARQPYRGPLPTPEPRSSSNFRWPVKGKIISGYGRKSNGAKNDGINISVPVGTTVRAAENGVVAYAGSQLKGYGNLVLVRHADNWVTAYAHNSDVLVQRGDRVKRGDIIAKAGRTGSVSSPQVHFEIRRGAKAVDPIAQLAPTSLAAN